MIFEFFCCGFPCSLSDPRRRVTLLCSAGLAWEIVLLLGCLAGMAVLLSWHVCTTKPTSTYCASLSESDGHHPLATVSMLPYSIPEPCPSSMDQSRSRGRGACVSHEVVDATEEDPANLDGFDASADSSSYNAVLLASSSISCAENAGPRP